MTNIGIISDIHANISDLEKAIKYFQNKKIKKIICAGDIVGYNRKPNEVIDILIKNDIESVRGNHDEAALTGDFTDFTPAAINGIKYTQSALTEKSRNYLDTLPYYLDLTIDNKQIFVVHGSPDDELDEYVFYNDIKNDFLDRYFNKKPDLLVLGHTHHPFVKHLKYNIIMNPGSISESRTSDQRPSVGVYNTITNKAKIIRID